MVMPSDILQYDTINNNNNKCNAMKKANPTESICTTHKQYAPPKVQVESIDVCMTLCTSFTEQTNEPFVEEDYSNKW